jgi:capsular exopolysaccharide synthesis family protein
MADSPELSPLDYLRPVWRFKWIVLVVVLVAAAATYEYYDHKPKIYAASTQLFVGASTLDTVLGEVSSQDPRSLADDAALVTTPQVAARVNSDLKLHLDPAGLLGDITVTPASSSDFLTLTVESENPQFAAELVNGFARAYVEVSQQNANTAVANAVAHIQSELASLTGPTSAARRLALTNLLTEVQGASVLAPGAGTQYNPAVAPTVPVSPKPKRNAIFAAALALLLGVIASYAFDRSDNRLRGLADFEGLLGSPVLASIPRVRRTDPPEGDPTGTSPELREPYRTLRVNLDLIRLREGLRVLMVTSAVPEEGKTTVVRNLAFAYYEAGLRVAIVDADMRRPTLAALFDVPNGPGLSGILASGADVSSALVAVGGTDGTPQFDLLPAGPLPDNPTALLRPDAFRSVRHQLLADHDIVIVDSPPVLAVSDAVVMAGEVDGILVVVRSGLSTDSTVKRLRHTFRQMPEAKLIGAVANAVEDDVAGSAYGYYSTTARPQPPAAAAAASTPPAAAAPPTPSAATAAPASAGGAPLARGASSSVSRAGSASAASARSAGRAERSEQPTRAEASAGGRAGAVERPAPHTGAAGAHDPTSPFDPLETPASRRP